MYYIRTEQSFDAAHFLKDYEGKCSNLHGHRWRIVAELGKEELDQRQHTRGMLMDFGDLKTALKQLCDELDHSFIFEEGSLKEKTVEALLEEDFKLVQVPYRPTAENFAHDFFYRLQSGGYPVRRIEVYETPANCAVYEESR